MLTYEEIWQLDNARLVGDCLEEQTEREILRIFHGIVIQGAYVRINFEVMMN
jgi:hypothetical protein